MSNKKKIIFVTGTRADYGKLKSIIQKIEKLDKFKTIVVVTGMHNLPKYGKTYVHILRDKIKNVVRFNNQKNGDSMDIIVSKTIKGFSKILDQHKADLVVLHGDRVEPLGCAIVSSLKNTLTAHIEGGEVSGSVDEILRHSISKLSHVHFVSNKIAKKRLIQMGELNKNIFVIGSPDVDLLFKDLPSIKEVQKRYNFNFNRYGILLFHPLTLIKNNLNYSKILTDALLCSESKFLVIYPNNDKFSDIIINDYKKFKDKKKFKIVKSMRFEYFLSALKNSNFIIGNSSAGIREAPYYGVPTINLGSRQNNRSRAKTIFNIGFNKIKILEHVNKLYKHKNRFKPLKEFGIGGSDQKFVNVIKNKAFWDISKQKQFIDI